MSNPFAPHRPPGITCYIKEIKTVIPYQLQVGDIIVFLNDITPDFWGINHTESLPLKQSVNLQTNFIGFCDHTTKEFPTLTTTFEIFNFRDFLSRDIGFSDDKNVHIIELLNENKHPLKYNPLTLKLNV